MSARGSASVLSSTWCTIITFSRSSLPPPVTFPAVSGTAILSRFVPPCKSFSDGNCDLARMAPPLRGERPARGRALVYCARVKGTIRAPVYN